MSNLYFFCVILKSRNFQVHKHDFDRSRLNRDDICIYEVKWILLNKINQVSSKYHNCEDEKVKIIFTFVYTL